MVGAPHPLFGRGPAGYGPGVVTVTAVSLRLPVRQDAPGIARREVVRALGLAGEAAGCVALLVSEAVTNSVIHTGLGEDDVVLVRACWLGAAIRIEVVDEGAGIHAVSPTVGTDREGGNGLRLIGVLADRWGLQSDGTTQLWFELEVGRPDLGLRLAG